MKFKNIKNKSGKNKKGAPASEFPRNFRSFPEKVSDEFIFLLGLTVILVSGLIVGLDLYQNLAQQKQLASQTSQLQSKLNFWQKEVKNHPDYRDGYFSLALISYQLKDFDSSRLNLEKALNIDPNFEKGRQLEELLSSNF